MTGSEARADEGEGVTGGAIVLGTTAGAEALLAASPATTEAAILAVSGNAAMSFGPKTSRKLWWCLKIVFNW